MAGFSACGGPLQRHNSPPPQCDPARRAFFISRKIQRDFLEIKKHKRFSSLRTNFIFCVFYFPYILFFFFSPRYRNTFSATIHHPAQHIIHFNASSATATVSPRGRMPQASVIHCPSLKKSTLPSSQSRPVLLSAVLPSLPSGFPGTC